MLFKKLLRTFGHYKAPFISMIIMIILGVAIFAGMSGEWYSIETDTLNFFNETHLADYHIYNKKGYFTLDDVEKIEAIEGVSEVSRFMELSTLEDREKDTIKLAITENFNVSSFVFMEGEAYDATSLDGLWLSQKYATQNNYHIGDTITLSYASLTRTFTIKGIIMAGEYLINIGEGGLMPDYNAMGFAYISPKAYSNISQALVHMDYYYEMNVISSLDETTFSTLVDKALTSTLEIVPKEDTTSYSEAMGEADEGKTTASLLPVIFLLIAVLTMVTTMNRLTTNEKGQIGILKALGFKNRRIIAHYTSYALFIGIVGSIIGIGLGFVVCGVIYSEKGSMGTYFEMDKWTISIPGFVYLVTLGIIVFLTLIGYLSVKKQLRGSAAEALRPYTPKAMKNLALEKTKLFHTLSFASRWNLRDTFRHKARTFMSIFGVFGCTGLLFASFGMLSTMNSFINLNYNVVMNYETRLTLADNVTNTQALAIADTYHGDYSANTAVKVNGETYVMTIFTSTHDMYRMLNGTRKVDYVADNGVYISQRFKEENSLSLNDTFTFSLYGENATYTASVIGIVYSNTNGFQLTQAYADTLGLTYHIDTVYTNTLKDDITTSNQIVSLQSKADLITSFDSFMEVMNLMIGVFVLFSAILAFVVLYNLGTMSFIERYRELATLKVLGFKNTKVRRLLISQNIGLTIIGIILGCPAGYYILVYLYKALADNYEVVISCSWYVYFISIVLTLIVSLCVSYIASSKVKHIDMVESLKAE